MDKANSNSNGNKAQRRQQPLYVVQSLNELRDEVRKQRIWHEVEEAWKRFEATRYNGYVNRNNNGNGGK